MRPKIGRLDNGEEQNSDAMKKLNFGGQMETNWLKSVNIGRKIEKKGSRIDKNGSTDERIVRKVEKSGPVRWASMALCWGGRCLLNKMFSNKKRTIFRPYFVMATLIMRTSIFLQRMHKYMEKRISPTR